MNLTHIYGSLKWCFRNPSAFSIV